jgi:3-phosphoshikimate 1-carboxyvinyltransferase
MVVQRYSGPGDALASGAAPDPWPAPVATAPLDARLRLPGSKSLTNRELVLAALADAPGVLRAPLHSRDSDLMVRGLGALGVGVEELPGTGDYGPDLRIVPAPLTGGRSIDCGLAGTVMRFLPPVAALATGPVAFDGDEGARRRPMRAILEGLRGLGIEIDDGGRGTLPFTVHGSGSVAGGELEIDASASSQFVSGLLLSAPRFRDGLLLRHVGAHLPSLPHIEMTVACLVARGVAVESPEVGVWRVAPGPIRGMDVTIEPDLSNAAPFLVAAIVAGGTVAIEGWPTTTTQVGADLAELLPRFGARVSHSEGAFVVDGGIGLRGGAAIPGVDVDLSRGGELAPAIVALAALASGPSRITGIGHLRGHETDRLAALVAEITRLGGIARELPDGIEIEPAPLHAAEWHSYADHRMATAGAILALAVPGIHIEDIATTAKTLPQFPALWTGTIAESRSFQVSDGVSRGNSATRRSPEGDA